MTSEPGLLFADEDGRRDWFSRAVSRGSLARLTRGVYSEDLTTPADVLVRRHIWLILSRLMPGSVITDLSVEDGGTGSTGVVFVTSTRRRPLALPGITVLPRLGAGAVDGDVRLPGDLWIAGDARALLDNLAPSRVNHLGLHRTGGTPWVERRIDRICAHSGPEALNHIRDQARAIAGELAREREFVELDALIGAALGTRRAEGVTTRNLRARASGQPFDARRIEAFTSLAGMLSDLAPQPLPDLPQDAGRRVLLPFYEAYFSNYIEGTEFTLDEAAAIVFDGQRPAARPADAHDVYGTYQCTASQERMREVPRSADELLNLLRNRHATLLGGRPDKEPGVFKRHANRAGGTEFVAPDLVEGTLREGFSAGSGLLDPFARAVFMMFLVSEVHPFADGNGRTARIFMNAELVAGGEVRIVIPTVFRSNYLSALKAATHSGSFQALVAVLRFAQRWTARVDWGSRQAAEVVLTRTNALRDDQEAQDAGLRLELP